MKKYIYLTISVAMILNIASCDSNHKKNITDSLPPVRVKVSSVEADSNNQFVMASGKIEAVNSANLSTRMMGYVDNIYVKVGNKVKKGQLLIAINNSDLQAKRAQVNANITKAAAAYKNAEKDYNRYKNLFADNSASRKELDDMTAHYEMAKAGLEAANQLKNEINAQFAYVNIRAPFNGIITNRFIEVGDMANPGVPLLAIESPKKFQVTAMVAESDISQIKSGVKVSVLVKSINKTIAGKVTEVSTSAKNTGGQYLVNVVLDKTNSNILSGMFATVKFPVEKKSNLSSMLLIPTSAIISSGGLKGIYTVSQQNTALLHWLRLGKTFGFYTEVLSGLNLSEKYIISSDSKLYNGVKVVIQ